MGAVQARKLVGRPQKGCVWWWGIALRLCGSSHGRSGDPKSRVGSSGSTGSVSAPALSKPCRWALVKSRRPNISSGEAFAAPKNGQADIRRGFPACCEGAFAGTTSTERSLL